MDNLLFDPAQEKAHLSAAIGAVYKHWRTAQMAQAYVELVHAVAGAELALSVLESQHTLQGIGFGVHILGLQCLTMVAHEEIARVERFALALVEKERAAHPYVH
jgi:hypothetical protein